MDDFYNEMKEVFDSLPKKAAKDIMISHDSLSTRESSFFPSTEALIPLNPRRWPAFDAGSAVASESPEIIDKVLNPLDNLRVAVEYLETSKSDVQWRARFWTVCEDTLTINTACEVGGDAGSFMAGVSSNKIAEKYMDEMIDNQISTNKQEELNFEIFKQVAREQGVNVDTVRGTGLTREYVPEYMKGDIFDRPDRNARPTWDNNGGLEDDGIGPHFRPSNPVNPSNDDGSLNLPRQSSYNSPSYSDESISNINKDDGNIFSKLWDSLGLGGNSANPGGTTCESQFSTPQLSTEEADRMRDKAERALLGWLFDGDGGGAVQPMCNPDPSHPSNNPPLFLPEMIPPSDQ